jgi:hypothetical protein
VKKKAKGKASKLVVRARIVPLALVRKLLSDAQAATAKFTKGHEGKRWSKADVAEHSRLALREMNANIALKRRSR